MTDGELHFLLTQILNREARIQFLVKERSKNLNEISELRSKTDTYPKEVVDELRASRESWKKRFEDSQAEIDRLRTLLCEATEKTGEP